MNKFLQTSATTLVLSTLAQDATLESDADKVSYGLGMMVGERVLKQYEDLDFDLLMQGMKAQYDGEATTLSMQEAQEALQAHQEKAAMMASEAAAKSGQEFLETNKAREGVMVTDSGLQYEVIEAADGPKPSVDDTVSVH